jgi:hypothetical protein
MHVCIISKRNITGSVRQCDHNRHKSDLTRINEPDSKGSHHETKTNADIYRGLRRQQKKTLQTQHEIELNSGLNQLSEFLETKLGIKNNALKTTPKVSKCTICKRDIGKGKGTTYKGKAIHKTCIAEAVQWL